MEELLIEKVRKRDFLYDTKSGYYRHKIMRNNAWIEIGMELNISPENAKEVWEKLRRCYINALNRRRNKSNADGAKKLLPWKYEEKMSFLLPSMENKNTQKNILRDEGKNESLEDVVNDAGSNGLHDDVNVFKNEIFSDENSSGTFEQDKNEFYSTRSETDVNNIGVENNLSSNKRKREEDDSFTNLLSRRGFDETDMLFLSLAKTTKMLPPVDQAKVKLQVSQIVLQAQIVFCEQGQHHS